MYVTEGNNNFIIFKEIQFINIYLCNLQIIY